jgi:hypothetical protein
MYIILYIMSSIIHILNAKAHWNYSTRLPAI